MPLRRARIARASWKAVRDCLAKPVVAGNRIHVPKGIPKPVDSRGSSPTNASETSLKVTLSVFRWIAESRSGLSIRRSLVRAQVGEPELEQGCERWQTPFTFAIVGVRCAQRVGLFSPAIWIVGRRVIGRLLRASVEQRWAAGCWRLTRPHGTWLSGPVVPFSAFLSRSHRQVRTRSPSDSLQRSVPARREWRADRRHDRVPSSDRKLRRARKRDT